MEGPGYYVTAEIYSCYVETVQVIAIQPAVTSLYKDLAPSYG